MFKSIAMMGALLVATVEGSSHQVTGYLIDEWCWNTNEKIALDTGAKLDEDPGAHTIYCSLVDFCIESGYLLLQKGSSGLYEHTHTLDAAGNEAFLALLKKEEGEFVREVTMDVTAMDDKLTTISNVAWTDTITPASGAGLPSASLATSVALVAAALMA